MQHEFVADRACYKVVITQLLGIQGRKLVITITCTLLIQVSIVFRPCPIMLAFFFKNNRDVSAQLNNSRIIGAHRRIIDAHRRIIGAHRIMANNVITTCRHEITKCI